MEIRYAAAAAKALRKIDGIWRTRIEAKLLEYATAPDTLSNMVLRLVGDGRLRLRVGDYRIIFSEDGIVMVVEEVGHRREIYRRSK